MHRGHKQLATFYRQRFTDTFYCHYFTDSVFNDNVLLKAFCWQCFTDIVLFIMFYRGSLYLEPDSLEAGWRCIKGTELSTVVDLVQRRHVTGKQWHDLVTCGYLILKEDYIHNRFLFFGWYLFLCCNVHRLRYLCLTKTYHWFVE